MRSTILPGNSCLGLENRTLPTASRLPDNNVLGAERKPAWEEQGDMTPERIIQVTSQWHTLPLCRLSVGE